MAAVLLGLAGLAAPAVAPAALTIDVGEQVLFENTPGQVVTVDVLGGDLVAGVNFYAVVADGGPEAAALGLPVAGIDGPEITGVDLLGGTFFEGSATQFDLDVPLPQLWQVAATVDAGGVAADGRLATLTIDTTGFAAGGVFDLALEVTAAGVGTEFPDPDSTTGGLVPVTITNGSIRLVAIPEPATLAAFALPALLLRRRR